MQPFSAEPPPIAARTCRLTDLRALRTNRRGRPPEIGDRAIFTLAPIAGVNRRLKVNRPPEAELWRKFEIARPLILGALLDATLPFSHVPAKTR
jgi:hypothetical protein